MGIEIELTGKCRGCRTPVLRLHQKETYVNGKLSKREYFAKCNNEDVCRKVVDFFALAVLKEKEANNGEL